MQSFTRSQAQDIGELMARVAETEIMPRFDGLIDNETRQKTSSFDVVTDADENAERVLTSQLQARFAPALILGEEAAARDASALAGLANAELAFIIDPIDGTKNFASGLPLFGVMVAATVRGEVVFGAIHDPVRRSTSYALRGEGAWEERAGRTTDLKVAPPVPVEQMHAVAGTAFLPPALRTRVALNLPKLAMSFWLRCAAHEYRLAASGQCHLLFYNRLMPWDHAAGWLLHREAGGYSAHFDGSGYLPVNTSGGLLCAPDEASWHAARDALLAEPADRSAP